LPLALPRLVALARRAIVAWTVRRRRRRRRRRGDILAHIHILPHLGTLHVLSPQPCAVDLPDLVLDQTGVDHVVGAHVHELVVIGTVDQLPVERAGQVPQFLPVPPSGGMPLDGMDHLVT
jgi:hypothetical protein